MENITNDRRAQEFWMKLMDYSRPEQCDEDDQRDIAVIAQALADAEARGAAVEREILLAKFDELASAYASAALDLPGDEGIYAAEKSVAICECKDIIRQRGGGAWVTR